VRLCPKYFYLVVLVLLHAHDLVLLELVVLEEGQLDTLEDDVGVLDLD